MWATTTSAKKTLNRCAKLCPIAKSLIGIIQSVVCRSHRKCATLPIESKILLTLLWCPKPAPHFSRYIPLTCDGTCMGITYSFLAFDQSVIFRWSILNWSAWLPDWQTPKDDKSSRICPRYPSHRVFRPILLHWETERAIFCRNRLPISIDRLLCCLRSC